MLDGTERKEKAEYQDQGSGRMLTGFARLAPKKAEKKKPMQGKGKKPRLRK
jgi:hypothetical protein